MSQLVLGMALLIELMNPYELLMRMLETLVCTPLPSSFQREAGPPGYICDRPPGDPMAFLRHNRGPQGPAGAPREYPWCVFVDVFMFMLMDEHVGECSWHVHVHADG